MDHNLIYEGDVSFSGLDKPAEPANFFCNKHHFQFEIALIIHLYRAPTQLNLLPHVVTP